MEYPNQKGAFEAPQAHEPSPDERAIHEGIQASRLGEHDQDDATARRIASQLHDGQASALYSLASSGSLDEDRLHGELEAEYHQQEDPRVREWIHWLGAYCLRRERKGPVDGWHELTGDRTPVEPRQVGAVATNGEVEHDPSDDEQHARQALMERITAAGVTTLGQVATIITDSRPEDLADETEADNFSWQDAAHWRANGGEDELAVGPTDELFGEIPDEEIGTVEDIGWYGLLRHDGRPGGIVLSQNSYGFRHVWQTDSDEELQQHWSTLQREYDAFTEAVRARSREAGDRDESAERNVGRNGHHPEIWVGSLSDYNNGRLHGVWLDATLDPDELRDAVAFMLRNSYERGAEEWAIMDYDDFCGLSLGEYESLETVSRIAKGIAEHGRAFAAWAEYVGAESGEQLDRFEDRYLGEWESTEAYAEHLLGESEAHRIIEDAPEWLQPYLKIDVDAYANDLEMELHVAEENGVGVWVFDPRC